MNTNLYKGRTINTIMNKPLLRLSLLILHGLANIAAVIYLTAYDITGSWLKTAGFILALFVLLFFFIRHMIAFINFIKLRP